MKRSFAVLVLFLSTHCFAQSPDVLQSVCDSNDPEACIALGTLYREGKEVPQSFEKAKIYFQKACELNDQTGCVNLGELYRSGQGVAQSFKQANALFKTACDLSNGLGCFDLASAYYSGQGYKKAFKTAFGLFAKGCDLGNGQSCAALGNMYRAGEGTKASNTKALEFYEKGCNLDSGTACNTLGRLAYNGTSMPKSYEKSATYYAKACNLDVARSCSNLGHMYEDGHGVPQDYGQARQLYEKACALDSGQGCVSLGSAEFRGIPDDQSYEKAFSSFAKACDLGVSLACNYLANCYQFGLGTEQSVSKAKEFYEKACKQKNGLSCFRLGLMAENGPAGVASYAAARQYFEQSCDAKDPSGCQKLAEMYLNGQGVEQSDSKASEYAEKAKSYSTVLQALFALNDEDRAIGALPDTLSNTNFSDSLLKLQTDCTRLSEELNSANRLHLIGFNVAPAFYIEGLSVTKAQDSTNGKINVNLNNYTTPLCKITFTKDEGYKGDFNYQYLLEQYSNKLSQQSIDFLKLRLSDQQKSDLNPTLTVVEEEKPQPIINVERKEEVLPKEIVITEDEPFDNLDKLIDEALENGQDIVVKSENAPVSPTKTTTIKNQDDVDWLIKAKPDLSLSPFGETKRILSGNNRIKRDQFVEQILEKVVVWRLPVKDIMKAKSFAFLREENVPDDLYYLYLWSTGGLRDLQRGIDDNESVSVEAYVTPLNEAQKEYLNNLESGWVTVKGLIKEEDKLGSLVLRPAILWDKKQDKPFDPDNF